MRAVGIPVATLIHTCPVPWTYTVHGRAYIRGGGGVAYIFGMAWALVNMVGLYTGGGVIFGGLRNLILCFSQDRDGQVKAWFSIQCCRYRCCFTVNGCWSVYIFWYGTISKQQVRYPWAAVADIRGMPGVGVKAFK